MKNTETKPDLSDMFYRVLENDAKNSVFMRLNMRLFKFMATVGVALAFGMGFLIRLLS